MRQVTIAEYGTFFALKNGSGTLATAPIKEPLVALAHAYNNAGKLAEALRQIKSAMEHHFAPYDRHWCIDKASEVLARWEARQ